MTEKLLDISKTAKELNLINKKNGKPLTATLRFWEKQFKDVKPIKLNGNRRYYDKNQLEKLKLIKFLLKDEGLTIKGAKNIIKSRTYALDDSPSINPMITGTTENPYLLIKKPSTPKNNIIQTSIID